MSNNWGRWGDDDQRGTLNLITPEAVKASALRRRTGKVYSLAIQLSQASVPAVHDRPLIERYTLSSFADIGRVPPFFEIGEGVGANEDVIVMPSHVGTHMDALSHVASEHTMYNDTPVGTFTPRGGAARLGIENTGSFAGPAKLLDVAGHVESTTGAPMPMSTSIGGELLQACADAQGTTIDQGDILLVRTGWIEHRNAHLPPEQAWMQAGLGVDSVEFIKDHGISAVGSDNSAIEPIPFDQNKFLIVHIELLQQLGVTLIEHLWLKDLADDQCYDILLAVGGLLVTGATGSPVNPIAIG
ncbi:MAG: putative cyclase [Ilumatobacteraceae bacterium]|nr:putative cyclase [Ilumatobacteraceae bacterium]